MKSTPRIFVGTLACGEAEFESCCAAIAAQTGVQITHHVIKDQPEYEAHNMLWRAWSDNKSSHDLFVKIDADTVLNRNDALKDIAALFCEPDVTGAQILIQDYFTDDLIAGLNAFSPLVEFHQSKKRLFADHADTGHKKVLKGDCVRHLAPIAWHGKHPSARQSFHFGFHRKLKGQQDVLKKTAQAWRENKDNAREWALAGAASAKWWMLGGMDYKAKRFEASFSRLQDEAERRKIVLEFLKKNYGDL
ncbi:MAG: hypothetical protein WC043_00490 [Pseudobdellovibrionaceae bacterium]